MPQPKVAAVGDCQADQADGGDLPVEEPLEEVGGNQGGVDVEQDRAETAGHRYGGAIRKC